MKRIYEQLLSTIKSLDLLVKDLESKALQHSTVDEMKWRFENISNICMFIDSIAEDQLLCKGERSDYHYIVDELESLEAKAIRIIKEYKQAKEENDRAWFEQQN